MLYTERDTLRTRIETNETALRAAKREHGTKKAELDLAQSQVTANTRSSVGK